MGGGRNWSGGNREGNYPKFWLTKVMSSRYPQLFGMRGLALFINGENVTEDVVLHDGDQAFFSPIVGGG